MSTETIDIVVQENGSRVVKRSLDDLGAAADKSAATVEALRNELKLSGKVQADLQAEVAALTKKLDEMQAALDQGTNGHKKNTNAVTALKKEMTQTQRTANFFARSLNEIMPASSGAGEGVRFLSAALIGGFGLSLAIEAVLMGIKLLAAAMNETTERQIKAIEVQVKYRNAWVDLESSIQSFKDSLESRGKSDTWITQQIEEMDKEAAKLKNELSGLREKLALLDGKWFKGTGETKEKIAELSDELYKLQSRQMAVAAQFANDLIPQALEAEERALQRSVRNMVASIDGETAKSKALTWVRQQETEIEDRLEGMKKKADELRAKLSPDPKQDSAEEAAIRYTVQGLDAEMTALESRLGRLKAIAEPIALAQGRQTATEWEKQEAENARRIRREQALLGATEYEQINARAAGAVIEINARMNKTLETMTDASEADRNRVRAASAKEAVAIEAKRVAEQGELQRKGGVLRELQAEIDPTAAAIRRVTDAEDLLNRAVQLGLISQEDRIRILGRVEEKYKDQIYPLGAVLREMDEEIKLLQYSADEREVYQRVLNEEKTLRQQGIVMSAQEKSDLTSKLLLQQELNRVTQARDSLYKEIKGPQEDFNVNQRALNELLDRGAISAQQYGQKMMEMRMALGTGNFSDGFITQLGIMDKATANFTARSGALFADLTNGLIDGISEATARSIVFGESFEEALGNVARQVLASLIAGLIKVGIQMALNYFLGESLAAAAVATNAAMGTATAAAWAPAAAMVSLASWGANSVPAMTAIETTTGLALTTALAGFQDGGFTGTFGRSEVAGVVHGQEYVVNADATKRNRPLLEAINAGASVSTPGTGGVPAVNITVQNYSGATIETQQLSPTEIRIIARDEARKAVQTDAPSVVASDLSNPNGRVSKALGRHTSTQRRHT